VAARLIALHQFQAITGRDREIVKAASRVNQLQFPPNDSPQIPRNLPSGPRVSVNLIEGITAVLEWHSSS
jgi:hypothetical protein